MNRRARVTMPLVAAALAISAHVFASPADGLVLKLPVLLGKAASFSMTCSLIIIDTNNQKHEIDPMVLGETERKQGHYNINPYMRFAGAGTVFQHIDPSRCIAIAGQTASEYGIQQVIITYDRSNEVTVSVPDSYFEDDKNPQAFTYQFVVLDGCNYKKFSCRVGSTKRFHNINPGSKEWSQTTINNVRAYF